MLGNSRFLIIVISVFSAVALICLGASAYEPVDFDLRDTPSVRRPPSSDSVIPSYLFKDQYCIESNSSRNTQLYNYNWSYLDDYEYHYIYIHNPFTSPECSLVIELEEDAPITVNFPSNQAIGTITVNGISYPVSDMRTSHWEVRLVSFSPIDHNFGTDLTYRVISGYLNPVPIFNSILSVGNKIVTFVMSSWVVLVPAVAFVCFLGFGVIRRLVKGV